MTKPPRCRVRPAIGASIRAVAAAVLAAALGACAVPHKTTDPAAAAGAAEAQLAAASAAEQAASAADVPAPPPATPVETATAAGTPVDPLRPEQPVDLSVETAKVDIWMRLRRGFALPDLDVPQVHESEQWYATRPDYVQRMTDRSSRYLFHILEEVERRGMPTELALLPFIESAFNPQAMSTAKASGMWQFIPSTGKDYELAQNVFRDDRRDVLASTRAALDHLQRLQAIFNDWQLTLAAYNWGEGNVARAVARNQKRGLPVDYLSLQMPNETRYYLPKLQAVKNIVLHPDTFGLTLPPIENHPYFLTVPIQRDIDSALVARLAGLPIDEFLALNPSLNKPVILAAGTPQVLLPYDSASQFVQALPQHRGPLASWTAWTVPKTMRPADAAQKVGMSEAALREVNRIPPKMLVKAGSTLLVPRNELVHSDVSGHVADHATIQLAAEAQPLRRLQVKARKHDTVAALAARYKLPAASVAEWNKVAVGAAFKAGQSVTLYVANKGSRPAASGHTARTAKSKSGNGRRVAATPAGASSRRMARTTP